MTAPVPNATGSSDRGRRPRSDYWTRESHGTVRSRADLDRLPAVVVLDRLPVPVLAVEGCGAIVFTNSAFADLLGHRKSSIVDMRLEQILPGLPAGGPVIPFLQARAGGDVPLRHANGTIIHAQIQTAVLRDDARLVLATFL